MSSFAGRGLPSPSVRVRPAGPPAASRAACRSPRGRPAAVHPGQGSTTAPRGHDPARAGHHPASADALRSLAERDPLDIPDLETAIIQLYALRVLPHMVFGSYGTATDDATTDRPITSGVDMFPGRYAPGRLT
ncbi:hypothetical protein ACFTXM_21100 [Streptomyces sp. NPDC056930]|uniref:hypothetical protein n=1 Tax=Streptomyces sp. NPDC056930 TaxID=3345967 RepID=UPI0036294805